MIVMMSSMPITLINIECATQWQVAQVKGVIVSKRLCSIMRLLWFTGLGFLILKSGFQRF